MRQEFLRRRRSVIKRSALFVALVVVAAIALGCGSPSNSNNSQSNPGLPQAITLSPAVADAKYYPNGEVQFVATGYYSTPPSPVTPLAVQLWGVCQNNAPTSKVEISKNGLAQCAEGANGTYSVFASDSTMCLAITACGGGCLVTGTAQLTCP
jgi:hypothetical protein